MMESKNLFKMPEVVIIAHTYARFYSHYILLKATVDQAENKEVYGLLFRYGMG